MDRLTALFEQLSLPEIARVLRRSVLFGIGVGIVALVLSLVFSHVLVGLGIFIGLGLGFLNIRLVTQSVSKVDEEHVERPMRVLVPKTLFRLSATTIIIFAILVASIQLGIGTAGGVALFYLLLLVSVLRALVSQGDARGTAL